MLKTVKEMRSPMEQTRPGAERGGGDRVRPPEGYGFACAAALPYNPKASSEPT